jgi:hypothetical protein
MILFLLVTFTGTFPGTVYSQDLYIASQQAEVQMTNDINTTPACFGKKRFLRAAGTWTLGQVLPWASNRYIRKAPFAKISLSSIEHNMDVNNLEWDDNKFFNNQFSHPFQGSLYFNAFRGNGYSFWESAPAALAGSLVWETICETHVPAPNDLINTTLGGIVLGEMSHRIANKIFRKKSGAGCSNNIPIAMVTDAGARLINTSGKNKIGYGKMETYTRIHLQYGDAFANNKAPFSNFSVMIEAGNSDSAKANMLQIEGSLYGKKIKQDKHAVHSFNISMKYQFFQNSSFVYGAQSVKVNLFSKYQVNHNVQLQFNTGTGILLLAAVQNKYMYYGEGRNYDYCLGLNFHAGVAINIANKLFYDLNYNLEGFKTVNGYQSSHVSYTSSSVIRWVIYKNLTASASTDSYHFDGYYKKYSNVSEHFQFRYFGLGYKFTF